MSERIKCPVCSVGLILPESAQWSSVTCPRCLAVVTALEAGRDAAAIQTDRPEEREERISLHQRGWDDAPDIDVRRDMKRTGCLVIVLAVIGGLSLGLLAVYALAGFWFGGGSQDPDSVIDLAVLLLLLTGFTTLIVCMRLRGHPIAVGFHRVAVGSLAMAGGLVTLGGLTVLTIFIFFLIICAGNGGRLDF